MNGITAIQMDIKIAGIDRTILETALAQALKGRLFILEKMLSCIGEPRKELSKYAPKIVRFTINPEKIREVIGPGGKMINKIIAETGVKIDIEDDGRVFISTPDAEAADKARRIIEGIAKDIEVGEVYTGKVRAHHELRRVCRAAARQGRHDSHLQAGESPRGEGRGRCEDWRHAGSEGRGNRRAGSCEPSCATTSPTTTPPRLPRVVRKVSARVLRVGMVGTNRVSDNLSVVDC